MKVANTRQLANSELPKPNSSISEVLHRLIENGNASLEDFPQLLGLRTRFSELRLKRGLSLSTENVISKNKHGHRMVYHNHILPEDQRDFALQLYHKLTA